jgi:hypothetical protein
MWGVVVVRGASMRPTLQPGDRLLVRYGRSPRAGDLVVVRLGPEQVLAVKRAGVGDSTGWWAESDNPHAPGALDSWTLGTPVPYADVLGVVRMRLWPAPGRPARPGQPGQPAARRRAR